MVTNYYNFLQMLKVTDRLHLVNDLSSILKCEQIVNAQMIVKMHKYNVEILCILPYCKMRDSVVLFRRSQGEAGDDMSGPIGKE